MPDNYRHDEIQDTLDAGPYADETWFRLQVKGKRNTKHLSVTPAEVAAIRDLLHAADNRTRLVAVSPRTDDDSQTTWDVIGDLRRPGSGWDETNHEYTRLIVEAGRSANLDFGTDPEMACSYFYCKDETTAKALADLINATVPDIWASDRPMA